MPKIILYNIPSKVDTWSGSIAKIKYLFDAKDVSYETVWVPFNKIEETLKARGVKPNETKPYYTLPAITIGDDSIIDSYKIVEYLLKNEKTLIEEGYLIKPLQVYTDKVNERFVSEFEKFLNQSIPLKSLLLDVLLGYEVELLNEEDKEPFYESRLVKGIDIRALQQKPKDVKYWNDAIKFLNEDLQKFFQFDGLDRSKFLTGEFVYGDEFSWADVLLYIKFVHYKELGDTKPNESLVPKDGLVTSQWAKDWLGRVTKLIKD